MEFFFLDNKTKYLAFHTGDSNNKLKRDNPIDLFLLQTQCLIVDLFWTETGTNNINSRLF